MMYDPDDPHHAQSVNLLLATLLVALVTGLAIGAMLLVRRGAPDGSYFEDGDRASGVFGVLATGFAILLGFVVFLAYESFDSSRAGAEAEARLVAQQFETAQFLPHAVGARLSGELICYARTVVRDEWPQLESGAGAELINPWSVAMFRSLQLSEPQLASEQAAFSKWLDQTSDREDARADRTHGAEGVIPFHLWIVLFLSAAVIFGYMLFFADRGERAKVQSMLIGAVAVVLTSTLLLLWFLDTPYHGGIGALQPTQMERTIAVLVEESDVVGNDFTIPCDESGHARG
jgi:hypothetical protein